MTLTNWRKIAGLTDGFLSVDRALHTAKTIAEKPTTITIYRDGASHHTEVVRLEAASNPSAFAQVDDMRQTKAGVIIVGYKSHPTITNTDIITGDRFEVDSQLYEVIQVFPAIPDRFLALAEASDYGV